MRISITLKSVAIAAFYSWAALPDSGLVAYFPFDGTLDNHSQNEIPTGINFGATFTKDRFGNENSAIHFEQDSCYVEFPDDDAYSISTTGALTISLWISPDTLDFQTSENSYIHWMGKGVPKNHEWTFRLYNASYGERPSRMSAYAFNLKGGLGSGSYVQESLTAGEWIHFVAVYDTRENIIRLYKNGVLKDSDPLYDETYKVVVQNGDAPLRIGTRDLHSFFLGKIDEVRIYNRVLSLSEIQELFNETDKKPDQTTRLLNAKKSPSEEQRNPRSKLPQKSKLRSQRQLRDAMGRVSHTQKPLKKLPNMKSPRF